jgi:Peptidase M50B-like
MTETKLETSKSLLRGNWLKGDRKQLLLVLAIVAVSILIWDSIVIYPMKVFVVFLHEISHGFAALLTGGSIIELKVFENQGGLALTQGGMPFVIASSGYLGSMIWGGLMFLTAMKAPRAKLLAFLVAGMLLVITLLLVRNSFGFIFGLAFAAALGFAALKLPPVVVQITMQSLGALSCLYALTDIADDLLTLEYRQTDAQILADMSGIPAIVWGAIWSVLALLVFYVVIQRAWKQAGNTQ